MRLFSISQLKEQALRGKMQELNIREKDIEEHFVRSSGKGGQHVNKTSTCVYLKHIPTGIEVKCQQERSQALNRYQARILLVEKIEEMTKNKEREKIQRLEKKRRQKRKRPQKVKEKILEAKAKISAKKKMRTFRYKDNE
ncbi:MAG: peptide chain release factor-like protein [Nitrospirae bacterium]|nr:peptide chain release factor-like protein [Nitrospirota bacterium]MCL5236953.1 peptide chain release factor-like protein [Nitrospirota bacterium]